MERKVQPWRGDAVAVQSDSQKGLRSQAISLLALSLHVAQRYSSLILVQTCIKSFLPVSGYTLFKCFPPFVHVCCSAAWT